VNISVHSDSKLYGWIPSRHNQPYYHGSMVATWHEQSIRAIRLRYVEADADADGASLARIKK
jgi:hypothetical protein